MHYENNLEDFAWFEVGNRRYYNKIHAVLDHIRLKQPIRLNVNDEEYSCWDWSKEPTQSLEELYAERARQIRHKYDYVVLHFSGGSDSGNILETFINAGLHIDEIITRGSYRFSSGKQGILLADDIYSEVLNQGLPLAQWARDNYMPHTKITVVDTTQIIYDYFANNPSWIEQASGLSASFILRRCHEMMCPHWRKLADEGKRVVHVYGYEKPKIYKHKNYFYTRWVDSDFDVAVPRLAGDQHPSFIECFYLGKNAIALQIKQLHTLKRYIKLHQLKEADYDPSSGRKYDNLVAKVIYKRTMPLICVHEKEDGNHPLSQRDSWLYKDPHSLGFQNWINGVNALNTMIPPEFRNKRGEPFTLPSKPYYLGE